MKTTLRSKALAGSTAVLAAFALFGSGVAPASALDSNHVYLNFGSGDTLGAAASSFEGGESAVGSTTHLSNNALKITKKASGQPWSGVNLLLPSAGNTARLASASSHTVTLDWWNPDSVASPVMLKMETGAQPSWAGGPWVAKTVEAAPGLNHLTFDMSTGTGWNDAIEYDVMAIFGNWSVDDAGYTGAAPFSPNVDQVYEVDNISINGATSADALAADVTPAAATSKVLSFESADTDGVLAAGTCPADGHWACAFEGAITSVVDAPAGGNGGKALQISKAGQAWAGVNLYDGTAGNIKVAGTVTLNFFSPDTVKTPAQLQLVATDNSTANAALEVSPGWNRLSFDMANAHGYDAAKTYQKVVIFPDFVNGGDVPSYTGAAAIAAGGQNYAIDDVAFNGGTTPALPTPVVAVKPGVRVAATVAGTAKVGKTLTAGKGSWTGTAPITYTYKWYRCTVVAKTATLAAPTAAAKCSVIAGATTASHKVVTADVGKYLRVLVTARNSKGSTLSLSKSTTAKATK
ncbi:MAG: hypothetical protein ORN27_09670 [Rhodoluna sp.]|nr:hypothetical protein [Rhodoluna sp.]